MLLLIWAGLGGDDDGDGDDSRGGRSVYACFYTQQIRIILGGEKKALVEVAGKKASSIPQQKETLAKKKVNLKMKSKYGDVDASNICIIILWTDPLVNRNWMADCY